MSGVCREIRHSPGSAGSNERVSLPALGSSPGCTFPFTKGGKVLRVCGVCFRHPFMML